MPAWRRRDLARTRRCPMVAGGTRKAEAIAAASRPSTVCRMSGARMPGSIAGWAQANIRPRRSSGKPLRRGQRSQLVGHHGQAVGRRLAGAATAGGVDQPPLCRLHQPGIGMARHAGSRPGVERGGEGVGQRILGGGDVASAGRQEGDQLAVASPGGGLGSRPRRVALAHAVAISQTGRTSSVPLLAPGHRAAHASAASRSGTSTM